MNLLGWSNYSLADTPAKHAAECESFFSAEMPSPANPMLGVCEKSGPAN
jgi:hypothetical protein